MPKFTEVPGERMCYLVDSSDPSHPPYIVDLLANKGLGHCSCENWGVVRWKNVKNGKPDYCKHLAAIRDFYWIEEMRKLYKKHESKPNT